MRFTSGNNKIEELEFCSNIPRFSLSNFDSHSQWFNREYRETHACLMALKSRRTRSTQIHHSIIKVIHITKQNLINIIFEWSFIMTNVLVLSRPRPRPNSTKKKMLTNESTIAQISLHISLPNSVLNLWNIEIQCRHLGNGLNLSFFFCWYLRGLRFQFDGSTLASAADTFGSPFQRKKFDKPFKRKL